jgi:very-short-patch-repair endonuclease
MKNTQEHFFNRRDQKQKRQSLRNNATPAEKILWSQLRRRSLHGFKFRRQHGIGPYIVDFYCPGKKLVVELDGSVHDTAEAREYDLARDIFLKEHGIRTLRFTNVEVFENIQNIVDRIAESLIHQK